MTRAALPNAAAAAGLLLVATALSGCGHSAPTRLFYLEPTAPAAPAVAAYPGRPVRVDVVRVPAALDRAELVRDVGPGEVQVEEFAHWAGPLGRIARQALSQDLAARLPPGAVLFGDAPRSTADTLKVDILAFRLAAGEAIIQVAWTRSTPGADASSRTAELRRPVAAQGSAATAAALSGLLGDLADRIVADQREGAQAR